MSDLSSPKPLWPSFHCGEPTATFSHTLLPQACALVCAALPIVPSAALASVEHSKSGKKCLCGLYISLTQLMVSNLWVLNLKNICSLHWGTD